MIVLRAGLSLSSSSTRRMLVVGSSSRLFSSFSIQQQPNFNHGRARARFLSTNVPKKEITIGIMRESYDPWERRTPLCPLHVEQLLKKYSSNSKDGDDVLTCKRVLVQPCSQRVYSNAEYENAGATISEDLSEADCILGVKRPKDETTLVPDKTYLFFSHVIKGQPENMKLLKHVLDKQIQLIDYECIVEQLKEPDSRPKRLVAFGKYAGLAGCLNTFYPLGIRIMSNHRLFTPFIYCPLTSMNSTLEQAKTTIQQVIGTQIATQGLPKELQSQSGGPIVVCVTGKGGNVYQGVLEILQLLPHEHITVQDLPRLFDKQASVVEPQKKLYILSPAGADLYEKHSENENEHTFDFEDFLAKPYNYDCTFAKNIAPYVSVLINCKYWDQRYPRLITKQQIHDLYKKKEGGGRLMVVSDISCDVHGSVEFLEKSTSISKPFFNYDPLMNRITEDDIGSTGITVMGVDILPSQLPKESSMHFGDAISTVLKQLFEKKSMDATATATDQARVDVAKFVPEFADAAITTVDGKLVPRFQHLDAFMKQLPVDDKAPHYTSIVFLSGHLFDSGLINQILDVVENYGCHFEFDECHLGKTTDQEDASSMSTAVLHITGPNKSDLEKVEHMIETLTKVIEKARATMKVLV